MFRNKILFNFLIIEKNNGTLEGKEHFCTIHSETPSLECCMSERETSDDSS